MLKRTDMSVYWITDVHLKDHVTGRPEAEGAVYGERHFYASLDKLRQSVDIVNIEKPDLVVCTGDVIEVKQSLGSFVEQWDRMEAPKAFVLGNHDLEAGYDAVVNEMGYQDRLEIAGSRFNCSFVLRNDEFGIRCIVLDTYVGEDGKHRYGTCEGTIGAQAFEWLEQEMTACPESVILLFSHNGIEGPEEYFDRRHAAQFRELARRVTTNGKKLYNLAGHHHVHPHPEVKQVLPHYTFVNGVAMIAGTCSAVNVLTIQKDGTLHIGSKEVKYPYPE